MKFEIKMDQEVINLAKVFQKYGAKLYVVGGYVRNALLGFCETDIDICSCLKPEEVFSLLRNTQYSCKLVNETLGTVHIYTQNGEEFYEHTTFRTEEYKQGGVHSPSQVRFVSDIKVDAMRRDFSANALYYDILAQEVIDYVGGINDVRQHILRTVDKPYAVFKDDGLRILRLVRIASELNFGIDAMTFDTAHNMISQLGDISQERFNKEMVSIMFADYKYSAVHNPMAYIQGMEWLNKLGAWCYVLGKFYDNLADEQKIKINQIKWNMLRQAIPTLRMSAFVCDIVDHLNLEITPALVKQILGIDGVMLNKKECEKQYNVLNAYYQIKNNKHKTENERRVFLQQNYIYLNEVFGLCKIAGVGMEMLKLFELMKIDKVPFTLKDLEIKGQDLMENYPELPKRVYSQVLHQLLYECASMPELNRNGKLLFIVPDVFIKINK